MIKINDMTHKYILLLPFDWNPNPSKSDPVVLFEAELVFSFMDVKASFIAEKEASNALSSTTVKLFPNCFQVVSFDRKVIAEPNQSFMLRWVSMPEFVGDPPTKKSVKAV